MCPQKTIRVATIRVNPNSEHLDGISRFYWKKSDKGFSIPNHLEIHDPVEFFDGVNCVWYIVNDIHVGIDGRGKLSMTRIHNYQELYELERERAIIEYATITHRYKPSKN
ncbi:MAG: hypothetical protein HC888_00610 [Candidatus Competibacteraceae bacterium]|nr:hypothetical protein [Candidatus Competibacteraceae bacterium]